MGKQRTATRGSGRGAGKGRNPPGPVSAASKPSGSEGGGKAAGAGGNAGAGAPRLDNTAPVDLLHEDNAAWARNLQGNILYGHGRDHTVHVFFRLPSKRIDAAKAVIGQLAELVTSAHKQETERKQYKDYGIPGRLFGNLFLSASGYRALGHADAELTGTFTERAETIRNVQSNFLEGMAAHAVEDLGDAPPSEWDEGFRQGGIDGMALLADDDEAAVGRAARGVVDFLEDQGCGIAHVERGTALRNQDREGIEHFGYVDGRSQPLFLASDFDPLVLDGNGRIDEGKSREKDGGPIDIWNPFEPLGLVLRADGLAQRADCLGSYFVFRKLEQNVRDFTIAEQRLADALGLKDEERERAGAMTVGRFRDGTPLVLNRTDGLVPPKDNNFRHDKAAKDKPDVDGLRCPFQGHIRKTNPRGDIPATFAGTTEQEAERSRRIARRGITYGKRNHHPNAFQALDDLPSKGVGLLFMCFQASIRLQFAFMQRSWANSQDFLNDGKTPPRPRTGIDPIIGQVDHENGQKSVQIDHTWHPEWDSDASPTPFFFGNFTRMRGGEFFFTPSLPYLRGLASGQALSPLLATVAGPRVGDA